MSNNTSEEKMLAAKAFCYDNNVKLEQIEQAWQNALDQGHSLALQLKRSGCTWLDLNMTVWSQLIERYGALDRKDTQPNSDGRES